MVFSDLKLFLVPFVRYILNFKCKDARRDSISSCYSRKGTECNTVHVVSTVCVAVSSSSLFLGNR